MAGFDFPLRRVSAGRNRPEEEAPSQLGVRVEQNPKRRSKLATRTAGPIKHVKTLMWEMQT